MRTFPWSRGPESESVPLLSAICTVVILTSSSWRTSHGLAPSLHWDIKKRLEMKPRGSLPVMLTDGDILREVQSRCPCSPMPLLCRKSVKDAVFQFFLEQVYQLFMGPSIERFNEENTHWSFNLPQILDNKQKIHLSNIYVCVERFFK